MSLDRVGPAALAAAEDRRARFRRELDEIAPAVERILSAVRTEGDRALARLSSELDRWEGPIEVPEAARRRAERRVPPPLARALWAAARNVRAFHRAQRPRPTRRWLPGGSELSLTFAPLDRVGLYAPGGAAPYPSTVLMGGLAAEAAGVGSVLLATPPRPSGGPEGIDPAVALAARLARIDRIFLLGGAAAIAAFTYGTETVPRVDKIVGPGNRWVTAAKRAVAGLVGTDALAGPSECLLVVDDSAPVPWVLAEAAAQVEHGPHSEAVVVLLGPSTVRKFEGLVGRGGPAAPGGGVRWCWCRDAQEAYRFADAFAPETLFVAVRDVERWRRRLPACGAAFLGARSSVPFGDYVSGTNHILPVMGTARFAGGLSVYDLGRWVSVQRLTAADARRLAPIGAKIAGAEGMRAHAAAMAARGVRTARRGRGTDG